MSKSFATIILCALIAGMFLCVFLAVLDNITPDYGLPNILLQVAILTPYIFIHFVIGAGIWGYETGGYTIHNSVFYLLFVLVLIFTAVIIKSKKA